MTATMKLDEKIETAVTPKGWHTDPWDQHDLRYHDGNTWTEHVTHFGPVPCRGCNPICH